MTATAQTVTRKVMIEPNTSCGICLTFYFDESGCDPCPKCSASFQTQCWPICHACGEQIQDDIQALECDDQKIRSFHEKCAIAALLAENRRLKQQRP